MTDAQDTELGKGVLETLLQLKESVEEGRMRLQEREGQSAALSLERERVMESPRYDGMERHTLEVMIQEEELQSLQRSFEIYKEQIQCALSHMPDLSARLLRQYYLEGSSWPRCAEYMGFSDVAGNFRRARNQAFADFWITYQIASGQDGVILRAKECRMWKRYYENQRREGAITVQQEKEGIVEKTGVSLRQLQRRIRLLMLIPELQRKVNLGQICEGAAYHLSFLTESCQHQLIELMNRKRVCVGIWEAKQLRKLTLSDWVHQERVEEILIK